MVGATTRRRLVSRKKYACVLRSLLMREHASDVSEKKLLCLSFQFLPQNLDTQVSFPRAYFGFFGL